jgi:hypothetical protein
VIEFLDVLIFFHIVLFVYWLGADLGVYYASRFVVKPELSVDARGMAAKIMEFVDLSPRVALVLFLPSGVSLMVADNKGATILSPQLAIATWVGSIFWLYLVIRNYRSHGDPRAALVKRVDLSIRYLLVIGMTVGSLYVLVTPEPFGVTTNPKWLAIKIILYSVAISGGIGIRKALIPFGPAFVKIISGKSDQEAETTLSLSLKKAIPFVHLIWACVFLSAFLGVTKPGANI